MQHLQAEIQRFFWFLEAAFTRNFAETDNASKFTDEWVESQI